MFVEVLVSDFASSGDERWHRVTGGEGPPGRSMIQSDRSEISWLSFFFFSSIIRLVLLFTRHFVRPRDFSTLVLVEPMVPVRRLSAAALWISLATSVTCLLL